MWAGSMNTGRFGMRTGKRRFSSAPTACGTRVRSPTRRDGIWTCPIARACSDTWRTCSLTRSTALAAGSISPPAISTSFRSATRTCTSRRSPIRARRSDMRDRKGSAVRPPIARARGKAMSLCRAATGFVFDNEKWAHDVEIAPFHIAKAAVTNAEFASFVDEGGYRRCEFWNAPGWEWRQRVAAGHPAYWLHNQGGSWTWRSHDKEEALPPHAPVTFVNWYEAQAYCNWAKRRLPSEAEWEAAAVGAATADGSRLADGKRRWPWGEAAPSEERANLDFAFDGPIDVAACAAGDSAFGCRQ